MASFLGKAHTIDDVDDILFTQRLVHQLPVLVQLLLIKPTSLADKLLIAWMLLSFCASAIGWIDLR